MRARSCRPRPDRSAAETVKLFSSLAEQLEGPSGEDVRRLYVQDLGTRDEELARWIVDMMCTVSLPSATAVVRGVTEWNGVGALALCSVPTLLLRSTMGANPDALRLRAIKPDLELGITVGAGHFHQLEVPEQVNAMIERLLAIAF